MVFDDGDGDAWEEKWCEPRADKGGEQPALAEGQADGVDHVIKKSCQNRDPDGRKRCAFPVFYHQRKRQAH